MLRNRYLLGYFSRGLHPGSGETKGRTTATNPQEFHQPLYGLLFWGRRILWGNGWIRERTRLFLSFLFFFTAPITCHHFKLIMSWKLNLRKTAELGFYPAPLPLWCFFPFFEHFHSPSPTPILTSSHHSAFLSYSNLQSSPFPTSTNLSFLHYCFLGTVSLFLHLGYSISIYIKK